MTSSSDDDSSASSQGGEENIAQNTPSSNTTTQPAENELTPEQEALLLNLTEICSTETTDTCKRALQRNNWNLENSVMELISPPTETPAEAPTQQQPVDNDADDESLENLDFNTFTTNIPTAPSAPFQTSTSDTGLRRRHVPAAPATASNTDVRRQTYADAARRAAGPLQETFVRRAIRVLMNMVFSAINVPFYVVQFFRGYLPITTRGSTPSAPRKSPRQEVLESVEGMKRQCPLFAEVNFCQIPYSEALTKSKTQVRWLLCYVRCPEHGDTSDFLTSMHPHIVQFMEEHDAILWTCDLSSYEGDKAATELCISKHPCISLLAPVSAARVSVVSRIHEARHWPKLEEARINHAGEIVVLQDERRQRQADQQLRTEQERAYEAAAKTDYERVEARERAEQAERDKQAAKEQKLCDIEAGKKAAVELLASAGSLDMSSSVNVRIKMPSGETLQQKFSTEAEIKHIKALILSQDETTALDFQVLSQYPKKVHADNDQKLKDAFGGAKQQLLMVQATKDETIESEESSDETESTSSDE